MHIKRFFERKYLITNRAYDYEPNLIICQSDTNRYASEKMMITVRGYPSDIDNHLLKEFKLTDLILLFE